MTPPVRLVLVDDHEMVIEGLKAMLAAFDDRVQVVGQAVGAERALAVVTELDPDIVLCDVRMQGLSGLDLCRDLRERDPDRKVVMLSVYDDEQYLFQALRVGAAGYLLKSISSDELVRQSRLFPLQVDANRFTAWIYVGEPALRHAVIKHFIGSLAGGDSVRDFAVGFRQTLMAIIEVYFGGDRDRLPRGRLDVDQILAAARSAG